MKNLNLILLTLISLILLVGVNAATVSHPASEITAGTFDAGDFTFNGLLNIDTVNSYSAIDFYDNGINKWGMGKNPSNNFYIDLTGIGNAITIDNNRNVGIGTVDPKQKLEVNGLVRVGRFSTASRPVCDANAVGGFVFDTTIDKPFICTAAGWKPLDSDFDEDGVLDNFDCAPEDVNRWQYLDCYIDNDGDTVRSDYTTSVCVGSGCGFSTLPGTDCAGLDDTKWRNRYRDNDGDGHCPNAVTTCVGNEGGYIDSCTRTDDCDDGCGDCYVGSILSTPTPDGKDQNCDGINDDLRQKNCDGSLVIDGVLISGLQTACDAWCGSSGSIKCDFEWHCCEAYTGFSFDSCSFSGIRVSSSSSNTQCDMYRSNLGGTCVCLGQYQ